MDLPPCLFSTWQHGRRARKRRVESVVVVAGAARLLLLKLKATTGSQADSSRGSRGVGLTAAGRVAAFNHGARERLSQGGVAADYMRSKAGSVGDGGDVSKR